MDYKSFKHNKIIISSRGKVYQNSEIIFPFFEVFASPPIIISDVTKRRFSIIDRTVQKARQEIMAQEDENIFKALEKLNDET